MARGGRPFKVDTHPTKNIVVDGLTRDASVEACIFDLIDNSIDAAHSSILKHVPPDSKDELPDNYSKYKIELTLNGGGFRIEDNCGGISVEDLKELVLRFGERSSHPVGIGAFGVGLNRALFKLGRLSVIKTDTGKERAELTLDVNDYLQHQDEWGLTAEAFSTSGKVGTEIDIKQLPHDIARDFADNGWVKKLRHSIGRRYGHFIAKKLAISINSVAAKNEDVKIRENPPVEYEGDHKFYKTDKGISIYVEYGQHKDHRFSNEPDNDQAKNSELTSQYGWNVFCNDRAILVSDQSRRTGWDTKFHTEHYGFVGIVSFVGDPEKLPWNTMKTDVDLNNEAYALALKDMREFAERWRAMADKRKKAKTPPRQLPPKKRPTPPTPSPKQPTPKPTPPAKTPITKPDHNQFRTVLPEDVNEQYCSDKILALVHEAKKLDLDDTTYSGLALIRMLFETATVTFLTRHSKIGELVEFAANRYEKAAKKKLSNEERKKIVPKVDDIIPFLQTRPELWGAGKATYLKHCVSNMGKHQPRLNSALHNPWQTIHKSEAFQIRDEALPLLRHLIET